MPSIKDIAELANVSICTVSRYLNNKIQVKQETEGRILRAIEELGYVPNAVAQSLKRNSTSNIAVILPRITSSYYADMTGGISSELSQHGYNLFIYEVDHLNKSEEEILQLMRENMVAGVIFIGMSYDLSFRENLAYLGAWNIPVVYANRLVPHESYPLVYPDFLKAGRLAAEHLVERGKRRLALVNKAGREPDPPHSEGFRQALRSEHLGAPLLLESRVEVDDVDSCVNQLLENRIDGVFVQNELLAVHVMKRLSQRGVKIPQEIAVVGFGNSPIGELSCPELSCVDLQNHQLGIESARVILRQIQHESFEPVTVLEPFILPRSST